MKNKWKDGNQRQSIFPPFHFNISSEITCKYVPKSLFLCLYRATHCFGFSRDLLVNIVSKCFSVARELSIVRSFYFIHFL
ncbi:MAG TPA: hypothetical protein DCY97_14085 [Marinilabiliales bacterium]|nr:hypothetical protein [Marinilabiliales bacterium]